MLNIRKFSSLMLFVMACIWLAIGSLHAFGSGRLVEHSVENSRSVAASFQVAATYIEQFKEAQSRLPSTDEFERWAATFPARPYSPHDVRLVVPELDSEAVAAFGNPPPDAYLLRAPRSDWDEYYASWLKKSTAAVDSAEYYVLGNSFADATAVILVGAFLIFIATRLGRDKKNSVALASAVKV